MSFALNRPRFRTAVLVSLLAGLTLSVSACGRLKAHRGYIVDETLIGAVQPGVDNRNSVIATLGRPTFAGQFDDRDWYYLSTETRQLAFASPKPTEQTLLRIRFDGAGRVESIERSGLERVASIDPVDDKTPTLGRERGFFEDIFGNIGAVGAAGTGGSGQSNDPTRP